MATILGRLVPTLRDEYGMTDGVSGMGFGFDLLWASAILAAGLRLHADRPGPWQTDTWLSEADKALWRQLCGRATTVTDYNEGKPYAEIGPAAMHARNAGMVRKSAGFVVCHDANVTTGGTFEARKLVDDAHRPYWLLDPRARTTRHPDPPDTLF